ncbi:D-aspartate oxidase [Aricia agestis]|uniref:D-aspartate oxidase n=1 Tax=Aricia agestis TaxID=91739 RepID=UPI001C204CDB|nr:D-aspartate oxidase [Aricia agestis]XP_041988918.1 D-aspartate oxidase [Aricia agestis]XP_041988919.1 D-aspartate oxidase [Aricia agestis]XP_041988920.1 D-aspartate oxidase [Aricia agestis]
MDSAPRVAVVGGGVVGMTVIRVLQAELPRAQVTLIAENLGDDTTSCVAAGIFRPGTSFRGPTPEITQRWIDDSWRYWQDILRTADAPRAGVTELGAYIFSRDNYHVTRNHLIEKLVPVYREVQDDELRLCAGDWRHGSYFSTVKIGCDNYLPWVERSFLRGGGKILREKVASLSTLGGQYELVFNCTGMGAKLLCGDHDLVPLRGQVLRVRAPWLKTAFYGDYDTYVIPGAGGAVTLGGVRQYDSYDLSVSPHDTAAIRERCEALLPALRGAELLAQRVGLRPHRVPVRVEAELGWSPVVHCYGHGGYGVTCAPGTALHAVRIGLDLLRGNTRSKI